MTSDFIEKKKSATYTKGRVNIIIYMCFHFSPVKSIDLDTIYKIKNFHN